MAFLSEKNLKEKMQTETTQSQDNYILAGEKYLINGDLHKAKECFKWALYENPGDITALNNFNVVSEQIRKSQTFPPILIATIPKSGTVFIASSLRNCLGIVAKMEPIEKMITTGELQIIGGRFPDISINYSLLQKLSLSKNGAISISHLPPTNYNSLMVNSSLEKMVVNIRDPRQVILSNTHHINALKKKEPFIVATYHFPKDYFDLPLINQVDYQIENWLPVFINWVEGWLDVSEDPRLQLDILFTHFEDMKNDPQIFFRSILEFYGISKCDFKWPLKPKAGQLHFRKGCIDEWRLVFTPEQERKASDMISDRLYEKFGWVRG